MVANSNFKVSRQEISNHEATTLRVLYTRES